MEETYQPYKSVPYGWVVYAAAAARWLARVLSATSCVKDGRTGALERLEGGLNHPAGPH